MKDKRQTPYRVDGTDLSVDPDFMDAEAMHAEALTAVYVDELPEHDIDWEQQREQRGMED